MFILRRIFALMISLWFMCNPVSTATVGFTQGTPITPEHKEYRFDNDRLLIGAYAFRTWGICDDNVRYMKEAGLDFIISNATEEYLDLCQKYGIGVIAQGYSVPHSSQTIKEVNKAVYDNLTYESIKDHPAIWGADIIDEPTLESLDASAECLRSYDELISDRMGYINLLPSYGFGESSVSFFQNSAYKFLRDGLGKVDIGEFKGTALEQSYAKALYALNPSITGYREYVSDFINKVPTDYISLDVYPMRANDVTIDLWLPTLDVCAVAARETGRDLWVISQVSGYHANSNDGDVRACSTEDIRWQVYTSLAFGAKAVVHATYLGGWWDNTANMIDDNSNRTDAYYSVQKVNSEVEPFKDIYGSYKWNGCFLTNGSDADGTESGYLASIPEEQGCTIKTEAPVLTGCFSSIDDSSSAYVFVNMNGTANDEKAHINVTFDECEKITVYRKGQTVEINSDELDIELDNEEGIFVTVSG